MPFEYRHQPFKAFYLTQAVVLFLVSLPFWLAANAIPSRRPRTSWPLSRILVVKAFRAFLDCIYATELPAEPSLEESATSANFVWVEPAPDLVVGEVREMAETNGVEAVQTGGFWYGPRGSDGEVGQKAARDEKVIYHMHGGAYVMGSSAPSVGPMKTCFEGLQTYCTAYSRIFALEYRLSSAAPFSSRNPYPACLIDAVAGLRYLVEDVGFPPENILLSGDSAGATLAFALAYYLHKHADLLKVAANGTDLSNTGGLLMVSPTVDWTHPRELSPGSTVFRHWRSDFVHPIFESGYPIRALAGRLPPETVTASVYLSPGARAFEPAAGMLAGMPRTCIVTGGAEQLVDSMWRLRDRLRADNGEERMLHVEERDATHDVLVSSWQEPERTNVLKKIAAWTQEIAGQT